MVSEVKSLLTADFSLLKVVENILHKYFIFHHDVKTWDEETWINKVHLTYVFCVVLNDMIGSCNG